MAASASPSSSPPPLVPPCLRGEDVLQYDARRYDLAAAAASLLGRAEHIGAFPDGGASLERFAAAVDTFRSFKARQALYRLVGSDEAFLRVYEALVVDVVLPRLKARLAEHAAAEAAAGAAPAARRRFHYQHPPTMRLQPGPSAHFGPTHADVDYGHQPAEVNFWAPLTSYELTSTTLWVESAPGAADFHPLEVGVGEVAAFHGALCRHRAPPNASAHTRVSLDFRVGVGPFFDPAVPVGTKATHTWRECWV